MAYFVETSLALDGERSQTAERVIPALNMDGMWMDWEIIPAPITAILSCCEFAI
jgi:hypothetical protein